MNALERLCEGSFRFHTQCSETKIGPRFTKLVFEFASCKRRKAKLSAHNCLAPSHARAQVNCRITMPIAALLETADVAELVLGHLDTTSMVALSCVSRAVRVAQRGAISHSPKLLVTAALNAHALTKSQLMGWFALQSVEADMLPRTRHKRLAGGFYFLYQKPAFESVLGSYLGNGKDWEERLRLRQAKPPSPKRHCRKRPTARPASSTRRITACR